MSPTTRCPACQLVLNLPEGGEGRRLKCPKCGEKFYAGEPGSRPPSSAQGVMEARPTSSTFRPSPQSGHGDADLPTAPGDLREVFDLPLLLDEEAPAAPQRPPAADPASLLVAEESASRRRPRAAEARREARRCPSCGQVVPAGMSLCNHCGLDLETGRRHVVEELLADEALPPPTAPGPPLTVTLIGTIALGTSLILALVAFLKWQHGLAGAQYLALVCLFGIFAAIQFLRGRSARPLLATLLIGAIVDIIALIALPVWRANIAVEPIPTQGAPSSIGWDDPEASPVLRPYDERLDTQSITWGVVILLLDGAVFTYLLISGVRRHFDKPDHLPGVPMD
ncbi:MAG: hypothetical protein IRY99_05430 [Isosphaeraceae bacterium]|nr:hypothetical protein [Isosphaeraceae bacterium]